MYIIIEMPPAIAAVVLLGVNLVLMLGVTLLAQSPAYGECVACDNEAETVVGGQGFCNECATGQDKP